MAGVCERGVFQSRRGAISPCPTCLLPSTRGRRGVAVARSPPSQSSRKARKVAPPRQARGGSPSHHHQDPHSSLLSQVSQPPAVPRGRSPAHPPLSSLREEEACHHTPLLPAASSPSSGTPPSTCSSPTQAVLTPLVVRPQPSRVTVRPRPDNAIPDICRRQPMQLADKTQPTP